MREIRGILSRFEGLLCDSLRCRAARLSSLGSIATGKYVDHLLPILGSRLRFPTNFVGRGDMSRGGLMLRCVAEAEELDYLPVEGAVRRGMRAPKLAAMCI